MVVSEPDACIGRSWRLTTTLVAALVALTVVGVGGVSSLALVALLVGAATAVLATMVVPDHCVGLAFTEQLDDWAGAIDVTTGSEVVAAGLAEGVRALTGAAVVEIMLFRNGVGWRIAAHGEATPDAWQPLSEQDARSGLHAALAAVTALVSVRPRRLHEPADSARLRAVLGSARSDTVHAVGLRGANAHGVMVVTMRRDMRPPADLRSRLRLLAARGAGMLDAVLAVEHVRNAAERQLRTATTDVLTGLPNRPVLVQRVDDAAALSSDALPMAVVLINLDRFREINATFGHEVGDALIRQFGTRLRDALPVTATVARLGGDEFAVLLCEVADHAEVGRTAVSLLDEVRRSFTIGRAELQLDASMGVALAPVHGTDAVRLLQHADIAMEDAKAARSGIEVFDPEHAKPDSGRLALLVDLRQALQAGQLSMAYQPKASLRTGEVHSVEALVRWNHPGRGRVPPGEFIPIAERTGLIHDLTRWVLRDVLTRQREWLAAGRQIEVAVNLSARNLLDADLPGEIAALLDEHRVPARLLRLEITESSLIVDPGRVEAVIAEIDRLGISLSVDDFGTGYSSMAHLLRLPVDEIKIDRSFVSGLLVGKREAAIVRATVDLGRRLGISVTAEGVEDPDTWRRLSELGCDVGQGFWLARPMHPDALERWLDDYEAAVTTTWVPARPDATEAAGP